MKGKVAVITGATSGFGKGTAEVLAAKRTVGASLRYAPLPLTSSFEQQDETGED